MGAGCTGLYLLFSRISGCQFDGETECLVTGLHSCLNTLGVVTPDATALAVRGAESRGGVEFEWPISSVSGMGSPRGKFPVAAEGLFPVSVVCLVLYMRWNEERNGRQQWLRVVMLSMDELMVCVLSVLSV